MSTAQCSECDAEMPDDIDKDLNGQQCVRCTAAHDETTYGSDSKTSAAERKRRAKAAEFISAAAYTLEHYGADTNLVALLHEQATQIQKTGKAHGGGL